MFTQPKIKNMQNKRLGFSLIELSIVILVIGILVVGITQGSRILRESRLFSARALTTSSPVWSTTGLILWLETSLKTSFDANISTGTAISSWYDNNQLSQSKNNTSQGTPEYRPTYQENVINGLPAVRFDSTNDHLIIPNFELRNIGNRGFAIFAVVKKTQSGRGDFFSYKSLANDDDFGLLIDTNNRVRYSLKVNSANIINFSRSFDIAITGTNFNILTFTRSEASVYNGYVNGTLGLTAAGATNFTDINAGTSLLIGSNHLNGSFVPDLSFGGDVAEIIIFNRGLKLNERKSIEQYLAQKYRLKTS